MTIKTYENEIVDFKSIKINKEVNILEIFDCEVHNFDIFIEKYPIVKFLTIHSKNNLIINYDLLKNNYFEYINLNKNVILQKFNTEKKEMEIIDIFQFGKLYLYEYELTFPKHTFYYISPMVFIQENDTMLIKNPYKKSIRSEPELTNTKRIYFFFTEPCDKYYKLFDNLPVDLEELYFNNLEYYNFSNLPPCLKKIHLNYPNIGTLEEKSKIHLENFINDSKIPFGCLVELNFI